MASRQMVVVVHSGRCRLSMLPLVVLLSLGAVSSLQAQARATEGTAPTVPRTPDGHPDLQGNWTNATLTPFQRPEGQRPVFTWEEVAELEQGTGDCPPNPGTIACGRAARQPATDGTLSNEAFLAGNEYNEFYWDRGSRIAIVNGEPRTSLVTRPANGRRPALTPEGGRHQARHRPVAPLAAAHP